MTCVYYCIKSDNRANYGGKYLFNKYDIIRLPNIGFNYWVFFFLLDAFFALFTTSFFFSVTTMKEKQQKAQCDRHGMQLPEIKLENN